VTSDSFGGLRALLVPSNERRPGYNGRRRRRTPAYSIESARRWALVRRPAAPERKEDAIEHVAHTLLSRYGVVFWQRRVPAALAGIAPHLPSAGKPRRNPRRSFRLWLLR